MGDAEVEVAELPKCLAVEDNGLYGLPWMFTILIILTYWIKILIRKMPTWFVEPIHDPKYDLMIIKLENMNQKLDKLQTIYDGQSVVLGKLQSDIDSLKSRATLQLPPSASVPGAPPPPPPPLPLFSLVTPATRIKVTSQTEQPKKAPTGPPQFSISQADISKMLQRLKKTSSTSRLLGSGSKAPRKTPPRRKLFGKTPGQSKRQSITAMSPRDLTTHKTPLSSVSPPAPVDTDINDEGRDPQK